jgi:hypothetical protein
VEGRRTVMAAPEGAQLDETGQWWWDGNQWQPVEGETDSTSTAHGVVDANGVAAPEGGQLDETGQWRWDGNQWQPVEGEAEFNWTDFEPELVMEWEEFEDPDFIPDQASGQVRFNPDGKWNDNAPNNTISCTFVVKNETPAPVTDVSVKATVNGQGGGSSPVTRSLAPGATVSATLSWPFKPPKMEIVLQIWYGGAPNGGTERHTVKSTP